MEEFGTWLLKEDWKCLDEVETTDAKFDLFQNTLNSQIDYFCPNKTVRISVDDPPWMNVRIKSEMRKRDREYHKNRKSDKWRNINRKCVDMCATAKTNYYKNFIENLRVTKPGTWMSRMKKLGKGPDEVDANQFQFVDEDGKNNQQLACLLYTSPSPRD